MQNTDYLKLNQSKYPHLYSVSLQIDGKQHKNIGSLDATGEGTFITTRTANHLFRGNNSLGINYQLLTSETIKFRWITIDYCGLKLISSREYFLKRGKCLQFKKKGYELQLFIPLKELNINSVKKFEELNSISYSGGESA